MTNTEERDLSAVRTQRDECGGVWYCAKDVCGVLGVNYSDKTLVRAGDGNVRKIDVRYGKKSHQNINFINGSGISRLRDCGKGQDRIRRNERPVHGDGDGTATGTFVRNGKDGRIQSFKTAEGQIVRAFRDGDGNVWYCAWDIIKILGLKEERETVTATVGENELTRRRVRFGNALIMFVNDGGLEKLARRTPVRTYEKSLTAIRNSVRPTRALIANVECTNTEEKAGRGETATQKAIREFLENPIPTLECLIKYFTEKRKSAVEDTREVEIYKNRIAELEGKLDAAAARIAEMEKVMRGQREDIERARDDRRKIEEASKYLSRLMECRDGVIMTSIAADYGISAKNMNLLLEKHGVLWRAGGQWFLKHPYADKGYTVSRVIEVSKSDGGKRTKTITEWTQKGRMFIYDFLKSKGILPTREREENR